MTIRNYSALLILVLWFSSVRAANGPLALAVRAYRESPSAARRTIVTNYAASHPREAPLAALALGIAAFEQHDYTSAVTLLKPIPAQLPALADYAAYYLAASKVEAAEYEGVARDLVPTRRESPVSPFGARSWLVEARALKVADPDAAVRILLNRYSDLPQPEADLTLADCYLAANQLAAAAEYYQRVYYGFVAGDAAVRAATGIALLKDKMGTAYPAPKRDWELRRARLLLEAREFVRAKAEYLAIGGEEGRLGEGAADYLRGANEIAWHHLRSLTLTDGELDAERTYYVVECARRLNDDAALQAAIDRLAARYPKSPWRLRALTSAANRYVLANSPDQYVPLLRTIYQDFPASAGAAQAHWKVTFQAWLRNQSDAAALLREHLRDYPGHSSSAGGALYFLGRSFEQSRDFAAAKASYQHLCKVLENHYYALRARERLTAPEVAGAGTSAATVQFLAGIKLRVAAPIPEAPTAATTLRIQRSRLLRTAGLSDYADSELRFGGRDGQPPLLAMEMASAADATHQSLRTMKLMNPDYLNLPLTAGPRKFWELLFPLPYKPDLVRNSADRQIDPYVLAGLIRQESEFNPAAVSRARAYGLTQIRPGTGRQFARRAGVGSFSTRLLSQPSANLKIGSTIFRSMLDAQGGSIEQTLAAYNAGPARVTEWLTWASYREPAEFVENIPFTETRDYVQAVMRNAEMYRRIYAR